MAKSTSISTTLSRQDLTKNKLTGGATPPCGFGRLQQFSGTCWFNAAINALFLSDIKYLFVKCWEMDWKYLKYKGRALESIFAEVYDKTSDANLAKAISICDLPKDIAFYVCFLTYFMFVRDKPFNPSSRQDRQCSCILANMVRKDYTINNIIRALYNTRFISPFHDNGTVIYEQADYLMDKNTPIVIVLFNIGIHEPLNDKYYKNDLTYNLKSATIYYWWSKYTHGHAISAFICEGKYYIYDSDTNKGIQVCEWRNLENVKKEIPYSEIDNIVYHEIVYLRDDWEKVIYPNGPVY